MVVADRLERLSLPMEFLLHKGCGSVLGEESDTSNISGVERKNKHERRKNEKNT
jgi:hypothetical protein